MTITNTLSETGTRSALAEDGNFIELDDDTLLANFRDWLPDVEIDATIIATVHQAMDHPFAIYEPNPDHNSFGITWSSPNEDITRCANLAMNHLLQIWGSLPWQVKDTHPNFRYWFHQSGSSEPAGYQFWEWLGQNKELPYLVCELLQGWLPAKTAQLLERGY